MANRRKARQRLPYIFAIVALGVAIPQAAADGEATLVAMTLVLIVANGAAAFLGRLPVVLPVTVNLLNSGLAFYLAWSLVRAGKQGLPYAYVVAGAGFLLASVLALRRRSQAPDEPQVRATQT